MVLIVMNCHLVVITPTCTYWLSFTVGVDVVVATVGSVTLPAGGSSTATIAATLVDDTVAEGSEYFLVRINAGNEEAEVVSGLDMANATILDNDRRLPRKIIL